MPDHCPHDCHYGVKHATTMALKANITAHIPVKPTFPDKASPRAVMKLPIAIVEKVNAAIFNFTSYFGRG